ncbi:DUF1289 domain-containing protein [Vibrio sp. ZSDZ34]|uniref:DUF1289 domain-containing protein n=1 Tax=Vibrio gelatinilyticus TaxID=2893468 RepID=A0A9X2AWP4_9VIBR|nr:DUF1289 domain-containing protein [Vibrio gelatinilyticus]MCJ2377516.1 DUF1289 domain-containing protein [Vibrio gelatinilyticus]
MEQLEFFQVPSPCVGVCTVDNRGYCQGCMRKREERFNWLSYTSAQQLHIIKLCKQRYYRKMKKERLQQSIEEQADINGQQELF